MSFVAFVRAHYDMVGGFRRNATLVAVYLGLVGVLAGVIYPACPPMSRPSVSAGLLTLVSILQGVLLLMVLPGAMHKAIQRDFQTGMLDSHRLSPMSGLTIALGYLTGPAVQSAVLFAVGLLVGSSLATHYGLSIQMVGLTVPGWWVAQGALILLAFPYLAILLLGSILTAGKMNLLMISVVVGVFVGSLVVTFVPGVALLLGIMSIETFINAITGRPPPGRMGAILAWSSVLQVLLGCVVVAAASRKIRRPDLPAFSIVLGLGLLAVATAAMAVGLRHADASSWLVTDGPQPIWQWYASALSLTVLAAVPASSAAATRWLRDRAAAIAGGRLHLLRPAHDLVPLACGLATPLLSWLVWPEAELPTIAADRPDTTCLAALTLAAISSAFLLYLLFYLQCAARVTRYTVILPALLHFAPLVIDQGLAALAWAGGSETEFAVRFGHLSPMGTLLCVALGQSPWPGLAMQAVLLVLLLALARTLTRQKRDPQPQP